MLKSVILGKKGSSSSQVDIRDISGGILKLSNNKYRQVMATSSINFELKSEDEKDALIDTFESFLNSIGFPIQLLIRTREIDIDDYLNSLNLRLDEEPEEIYKAQLISYRKFISTLISSNKILSRQFYVVIPYDDIKNIGIASIRDQLSIRADIVSKNLSRLGIITKQLGSIEVIDLFYSFYSPERSKTQPLSQKALDVMGSEFVLKGGQDD